MIERQLTPFARLHPLSSSLDLKIEIERGLDRISFRFILSAPSTTLDQGLVLPALKPVGERQRLDGLWQSTCLELFVGASESRSYVEMNLSPSGDWNIYAFDDMRTGMRAAASVAPPLVSMNDLSHASEKLASGDSSQGRTQIVWAGELRSTSVGELGDMLRSGSLVIGATTVLEYQTGEREYWALTHAGPKPDFHLRESFILKL